MSIYTNLIASISQIGSVGERNNHVVEELLNLPAQAVTGDYAANPGGTTIATHGGSAGNYTLTVTMLPDISYTTAAIAFDAVVAVIETALDTASPAGIADGDLAVSQLSGSAGIESGTISIDSILNRPLSITVDITNVTDGSAPVIDRLAGGNVDRNAAQALFGLQIISGTLHMTTDAPSDWTRPAPRRDHLQPSNELVRALLDVAVVEDGGVTAVRSTVLALYPEI